MMRGDNQLGMLACAVGHACLFHLLNMLRSNRSQAGCMQLLQIMTGPQSSVAADSVPPLGSEKI